MAYVGVTSMKKKNHISSWGQKPTQSIEFWTQKHQSLEMRLRTYFRRRKSIGIEKNIILFDFQKSVVVFKQWIYIENTQLNQ